MDNKFQEALNDISVDYDGLLKFWKSCKPSYEYEELNKQVSENISTLQKLIDIASTPICEDCEPKDLETAKIKMRLMASECNKYTAEYDKLKKQIDMNNKAMDLMSEKLYDLGYKGHCHLYMCTVATTCYDDKTQKDICRSCIKDYLYKSANDLEL